MKKIRILFALILALAVMMPAAFAMAEGNTPEVAAAPAYLPFTGTVTDIVVGAYGTGEERTSLAWVTITNEENPDGIVLVINKNTYLQENAMYGIGEQITAYIDGNAPAPMIYPPRYGALAILRVEEGGPSLKVDRFDADRTSSDGELTLNIGEDTRVISVDGTPYEGELTDKALAVYYTIATASIPAQTPPELVVVLNDPAQ